MSSIRRPLVMRHPGDAFVELFDLLPEDLFGGDEAEEVQWTASGRSEAAEVEREVVRTGKAPAGFTDLSATTWRTSGLARLIGLDRALRRVHPKAQAPAPEALQDLAALCARKGRFNTKATDGLLLPRLVPYGAPEHRRDKHEFFSSVVRVEEHMLHNIHFEPVRSSGELPTLSADDQLVVACVPFLTDEADIEITRLEKFNQTRYRLAPRTARVAERVLTTIHALDASGAVVGLLPEGALSPQLLALWQQSLKDTHAQARDVGSKLAVVLVGTGPVTDEEPPRNRAVLLNRRGASLWEQDKLCDYTLVASTAHRWNLPNVGEADLFEDITRGQSLTVVESSLGRLAVLICEDLQRCDTRRIVPRDVGVSHIFTPVFDAPLTKARWERFAGERHALWGGSRVVVTNSRVVGTLIGRTGAFGTALLVAPQPGTGSWNCDVLTKRTSRPTQTAVISLPPIGPPNG